MKNITRAINKKIGFSINLPVLILVLMVSLYSAYFSVFTIHRYNKMYAHYFDLGIMNQTVYNTYKGLQTGNFSRILELTSPHNSAEQIKRMAVHNDFFLALMAPFYFIHEGPETLLFIQAVVVAMGAVYIFLIAKKILKAIPFSVWISLVLSVSYLLYPPLQKATRFEFHPVTLATTFLLAMYYYWLEKKYKTSFMFMLLGISSKEHVGLVTALFGAYLLFEKYNSISVKVPSLSHIQLFGRNFVKAIKEDHSIRFAVISIVVGLFWVLVSLFIIIPAANGGAHFATKYYDHIKERPWKIFTYPFKMSNNDYFLSLFGPVGFLALLSPLHLFIALPEFAINLLSSNPTMRNTYYHYNSIITPFLFIATVYGVKTIYHFLTVRFKNLNAKGISLAIGGYLVFAGLLFSYLESPLPYAKQKDIYPWLPPQKMFYDVMIWKKILSNDQIKVSSTGRLAPHFTSRQYFYDFSWKYPYAEYIVIEKQDVEYGYLKKTSLPSYKMLQYDNRYIRIYNSNDIEVYRKTSL